MSLKPLLANMGFAERNLAVAYRASEQSQRLAIHVTTAGVAQTAMLRTLVAGQMRMVQRGGGASDRFPPWQSNAQILSCSEGSAARGPNYQAELEVAGLAPEFLRCMVEQLRGTGFNQPVTSMRILGELPVENGELSVTEMQMLEWLASPSAYPRAWPDLGFELVEQDGTEGGVFRVRFQNAPDDDAAGMLRAIFIEWKTHAQHFVGPDGRQVDPRSHPNVTWRFASSKRELVARCSVWPWTRQYTKNLLKNNLAWYHHAVAPIELVEVSL